jgi:hypothetical protein
MSDAVTSTVLGLASSVVVAVLAYWFTKRREREAEWRKEKLSYYKAYVESLSGIVQGDDTPEGHKLYAKASNNLLLFAPASVIGALNAYRAENSLSNKEYWSARRHDELLAALLIAIRKDVGVSPADIPSKFKPVLWASGVNKSANLTSHSSRPPPAAAEFKR